MPRTSHHYGLVIGLPHSPPTRAPEQMRLATEITCLRPEECTVGPQSNHYLLLSGLIQCIGQSDAASSYLIALSASVKISWARSRVAPGTSNGESSFFPSSNFAQRGPWFPWLCSGRFSHTTSSWFFSALFILESVKKWKKTPNWRRITLAFGVDVSSINPNLAYNIGAYLSIMELSGWIL